MIGWLQGQLAEPWQQANRCGALLICQGVGYEVQLSQRQWRDLPAPGSDLTLHIHHTVREDAWTLYGFRRRHERDLFRELVAVSGVGPQMALGLLGTLDAEELVRAIVQSDLRRLAGAPGVGKRTAERLAVELRARLQQRFQALLGDLDAVGLESEAEGAEAVRLPEAGCREEVQLTLTALGYEPLEIHRALRAVGVRRAGPEAAAGTAASAGEQPGAGDRPDGEDWNGAEDWIRACLRWLSREVA